MKSKVAKEMINNIPENIKQMTKQHADNTIMHNELIKLGFKPVGINSYKYDISDFLYINVCNTDEVWLVNYEVDTIFLFKYNHDKVKQLIELLK